MSKALNKQLIGDSNISSLNDALISAPSTVIISRAQIMDPSKNMGPAMGIDRILTEYIYEVPSEFGPNGERVFKVANDDKDLIRFFGSWQNDFGSGTTGALICSQSNNNTGVTGDSVEITFYGTGLNLLHQTSAASRDIRATVDGGTEGGNLYVATSGTLNGRNYAANTILPVVSGLTLGTHTVKLRDNGTNTYRIAGFEVLNERTTILVNSGSLIKNQQKFSLATAQTIASNPFSTAKGGRVVLYSQNGNIAQATQATDTTALYGNSASHSNEDQIRSYSWREFGAARTAGADDFSVLTGGGSSARAFALDDATTNLSHAGGSVNTAVTAFDGLSHQNNGNMYFTFVGTGLDIVWTADTTGTNGNANSFAFSVDGTSQFNLTTTATGNKILIQKVASGLPYGTHTITVSRNAPSSWNPSYRTFIVYGPKKPTVPTGAVELADYYVMANYVANTTAALDTIGTGVLRKSLSTRETTFVGTWSNPSLAVTTEIGGFQVNTTTTNDFLQYTFFGTGFDFRSQANTAIASSITVSLNGTTLTSTNFPTITSSTYGGFSFSTGTGVFSQAVSTTNGSGWSLSGLPLALYTIKFLKNAGGANFVVEVMDIITPIHSPKGAVPLDVLNTATIGSCSLLDRRQIVSSNRGADKYRGIARGVTSGVTTTSTSFLPVADLSLVVPSRGGWFQIAWGIGINNNTATQATRVAPFIDNIQYRGEFNQTWPTANVPTLNTDASVIAYLAPEVQKVDMYWYVSGGTGALDGTARQLTVIEL